MIKLTIDSYRDFTEAEKKEREEYKAKRNTYHLPSDDYGCLTPMGIEKYFEKRMEVTITEEQWNAIRKAVLESF